MTEQKRQNERRKKCAYCGGRISIEDRLRVQICCFKYREDNSKGTNPEVVVTKDYHKKCYAERFKDYERMKEEHENRSERSSEL